ncbi:MAG: hypothetical protein J6S57_00430 [Alphaproteobacteria bacterium]|nr:hypothetical protein [Alphaproteobacteria bacterium]
MKKQTYVIRASFLVPTYNMPNGMLSHYITTQHGIQGDNSIDIDVWLVNASKEQPKQSIIQSLQNEANNYQAELDKALEEEKPADDSEKSEKIRQLEYGKKVFSELVNQANDSSFNCHKPDDDFLKIARDNLNSPYFAKYKPDINNHLYLAALSYYRESR